MEIYWDNTLDKSALATELDQFLDKLNVLVPVLYKQLCHLELPQQLGLNITDQRWDLEVDLVSDQAIRHLNSQYRQKDQPTDVLSFPAWSGDPTLLLSFSQLPQVSLGTVVISMDWAKIHGSQISVPEGHGMTAFLVDRFIHGLLHLMGQHHDTMADFDKIVSVQNGILQIIYGQPVEVPRS